MQAPLRLSEHLIGFIDLREKSLSSVRVAGMRVSIGMRMERFVVKRLLHLIGVEPGAPRLIEKGEIICHAAKLSPQEQCATALGLVTLKPPF